MAIQNSTAISLTGSIGKANRNLFKILQQLSTGRRINRASDDAAGLSIAENLMAQVRGFRQASNNVEQTSAALQIGEGASNEISGILQRQRELAVQASNDTLTNGQRQALNSEFQSLTQEIDRIAESSQFNKQATANGTGLVSGTAQAQVGANAGDQVTIPTADFTAGNLGVTGVSIATGADARNAISAIDTAITATNTQRSTMGATINRFEHTANNLQNQTVNTQTAESLIRDLDIAQGAANLVRSQIIGQSAMMALRNFNQISAQNMMALLR